MGCRPAFAAMQVNLFEGTCYLTPVLGAWLADAHWGRYKTILVFSGIYFVVCHATSLSNKILLQMNTQSSKAGLAAINAFVQSHAAWLQCMHVMTVFALIGSLCGPSYHKGMCAYFLDKHSVKDHSRRLAVQRQ